MAKIFKKTFSLVLFLFTFYPTSGLAYNDSLVSLTSSYNKVLRKYTKSGSAYNIDQLNTRFKCYATYHSPEFLETFYKRFAQFYPEGQEGYAEELKNKMTSPNQAVFFIALYSEKSGLKRMTGDKNLWDIALLVKGEVFKPVSVERVLLTPFEYRFYPYVDKWYHAYRVVFPFDAIQTKTPEMALQISSVAGVSKLNFDNL